MTSKGKEKLKRHIKKIRQVSKILFRIVIYISTFLMLFGTVGGVIYFNFIKKKFDFENKGIENIGVVTRRKGTSKSMDHIIHYVDGIQYRVGFNSQLPGLTVGENFFLLYNPEDPQDAFVKLWKPLFLPHEATGKTTGKITCVSEVKFGSPRPAVCFEYIAIDNTLDRMQEIPMDYPTQFPTLSVGQHYEVEYWQENPKRAIIYLDRPVEKE